MARSVQTAIQGEEHLVVEAGTGVGKSFGYLVPAILSITDPVFRQGKSRKSKEERHGRLVVSTHTISLQEQLHEKDIPFLNSIIPRDFSAVLVKGRGNYISLRRLDYAVNRSTHLFGSQAELIELGKIRNWAKESTDGSLSDLPFRPSPAVWEEVASDSSNCMGRKCPQHDECFYFQARNRASKAQVLVVNHALFFTDLALREEGAKILPDYDAVILDEAHTMEAVAADHLGLGVTSGQLNYRLSRLFNARSNRGLLVEHDLQNLQHEVLRIQQSADSFFDTCQEWYREKQNRWGGGKRSNEREKAPHPDSAALVEVDAAMDLTAGCLRVREPLELDGRLSRQLKQLASSLRGIGDDATDPSVAKNFSSAADGLQHIAEALVDWCEQTD